MTTGTGPQPIPTRTRGTTGSTASGTCRATLCFSPEGRHGRCSPRPRCRWFPPPTRGWTTPWKPTTTCTTRIPPSSITRSPAGRRWLRPTSWFPPTADTLTTRPRPPTGFFSTIWSVVRSWGPTGWGTIPTSRRTSRAPSCLRPIDRFWRSSISPATSSTCSPTRRCSARRALSASRTASRAFRSSTFRMLRRKSGSRL